MFNEDDCQTYSMHSIHKNGENDYGILLWMDYQEATQSTIETHKKNLMPTYGVHLSKALQALLSYAPATPICNKPPHDLTKLV